MKVVALLSFAIKCINAFGPGVATVSICAMCENSLIYKTSTCEFLRDPATTSASEIDRTYLPIVNQLLTGRRKTELDKLKQEFHEINGVIIFLASPLSVYALTRSIDQENAFRVESFKSVFNVPDNPDKPVRILHLSLRDFLLNTERVFRV